MKEAPLAIRCRPIYNFTTPSQARGQFLEKKSKEKSIGIISSLLLILSIKNTHKQTILDATITSLPTPLSPQGIG
jgi:hypothetical protein